MLFELDKWEVGVLFPIRDLHANVIHKHKNNFNYSLRTCIEQIESLHSSVLFSRFFSSLRIKNKLLTFFVYEIKLRDDLNGGI